MLCFLGCTRKYPEQLQVINVKEPSNNSVQLSEISESLEMIRFETNDSCHLSRINSITIASLFFFVSDGSNIFQFNRKGNFIRSIGKYGRGPGEYLYIHSLACNTQDEILYVSARNKILLYNYNGTLLKTIKHNRFIEYLSVKENQLWAWSTEFGVKESNQMKNRIKIYKFSLNGVLKDSLFVKDVLVKGLVGTINPQMHNLSQANNNKYLYCPILLAEPIIRDTLYLIKNNNLTSSLKIDFGLKSNKGFLIKNIYRTDRFAFVEYSKQRQQFFFCYDFATEKQFNLKGGFYDNMLNTGKTVLYPSDYESNLMYFVKNSYELTGIIDGVNENDNPVLMLVKLKE